MRRLVKFWQYFFKPNDWRVVWTVQGYWYVTDSEVRQNVFYYISFSESRDKFKLDYNGYNADKHQLKGVANQELVRLNKELLQIRFNGKHKKI